jgi:hypothetical protein
VDGYNSTLTGQYYKILETVLVSTFRFLSMTETKENSKITKNKLALKPMLPIKSNLKRQFKQQQEQLVLKLSQNEMINEQLQTQLKINKPY